MSDVSTSGQLYPIKRAKVSDLFASPFYSLIPDAPSLSGATYLLNADETQASGTVPNADTALKTYVLATNTYSRIVVEAEGYLSLTSVLATLQVVNIKIKFGAGQVGQTMKLQSPGAVLSDFPFVVKTSAVQTAGLSITVTMGALAADANTTVFLNSLRVYGVV